MKKKKAIEWKLPLYHEMEILPEGIEIEHIKKWTPTDIIGFKGQTFHVDQPEHWIIKFNGKIIAIE